MTEKFTEENARMQQRVDQLLHEYLQLPEQAGRIIARLDAAFIDCDWEQQTLTLAFPVTEPELNSGGVLMGGITAAAADTTCGVLIYAVSGEATPPTVSLNISFVKPVMPGDRLLVTAKISNFGRRVVHLTAEGVSERTGATVFTSSAVFLSTYMMK